MKAEIKYPDRPAMFTFRLRAGGNNEQVRTNNSLIE